MTKEDIYTLSVEIEQDFLETYQEIMYVEEISSYKNALLDNKMKMITKSLNNLLLEIDCYKNSQTQKFTDRFKALLIMLLISIIALLFNPLIGLGSGLLSTIGIFKLHNQIKEEKESVNFKHIIKSVKSKLKSLEKLKNILGVKAQKREVLLQRERVMTGKNCLDIDLANIALGKYLDTLELPEMSKDVKIALIKMLQEDLHSKENNLSVLLDLAFDRTPPSIILERTR